MCGIAGIIDLTGAASATTLREMAEAMTNSMSARGPDGWGVWVDEEAGVALGHRRLSIIDLSDNGKQPMVSASGRSVIAYNGEVYNYMRVRDELDAGGKGAAWRGHSDTEVVLQALERGGADKVLNGFNGMFAFALWDKAERTLTLARDKIGKKPLYYGWNGGYFIFASELKAFKALKWFDSELDRTALLLYAKHNYIPEPYSIFNSIYKLPPACFITAPLADLKSRGSFSQHPDSSHFSPRRYWSLKALFEESAASNTAITEEEAAEGLEKVMLDAVRARMISDVPLGAFLSGGLDSSTVAALMQSLSGEPVRTFTIGFNEAGYNEAPYAKEIARHLSVNHTELYVTPEIAMNVIPRLPEIFDEPFADSSQIPTFILCEMVSRHVKVAVAGDGADELFGGYDRYTKASWFFDKWHARTSLLPESFWKSCRSILGGNAKSKLGEFLFLASLGRPENYFALEASPNTGAENMVIGAADPFYILTDRANWLQNGDPVSRFMYMDLSLFLPGDILAKVDRASMGTSLETRSPFLDPNVVEYIVRLPSSIKLNGGNAKAPLKRMIYKYIPKELLDRPKKGFTVPVQEWIKKPLRDWAEPLLDESRINSEGFLNAKVIREKWTSHLAGKAGAHGAVWGALMFQAWLEKWKRG